MSKKKEEDKLWKWIDNNHLFLFLVSITVIGVLIRLYLMSYQSGDYDMFLKPWFQELKANGGLLALKKEIGNYTPIYMTLLAILTYLPIKSLISIKVLSIIFDFVGAFTIYKIVSFLLEKKKYQKELSILSYGIYLFLPTVFLNSAYWAQSDSIYAAFSLLSIYFLMKENYLKSLLFFGIALSFKLQAIFLFPIFLFVYISERKIKLKYFLVIPLTIFLLSLPKALLRNDLLIGFKVFGNQSNTYSQYITLNFPNIYSIFFKGDSNLIITPIKDLKIICCLVTLMILITLTYFIYRKKIIFTKKAIIDFSILSILIMTFFLPEMHERYLYLGDVLAISYLFVNRKKYYLSIGIEIVSLYGYMYLLFSAFAIPISLIGILYLFIIILYTKNIIQEYFLST